MSTWTSIVMLIAALFLAWQSYMQIKYNRGLFTKANFSKTVTVLGVLAIFLIALIWIMVVYLRQG